LNRRIVGGLAAAVVAIALWFGGATPGLAAVDGSPSPPALATLIGCRGHRPAPTSVGGCPAIARGSSSAVHSPSSRRFQLARSSPAGVLAVVAITTVVIALVASLVRRAKAGPAGARAPPLFAR